MEKSLHLLYQITSQTNKSLNEQLNNALKLTTNLLDMEVGIISSITDDVYIVRNFYPPDAGLSVGQEFELGNTYCSITLQSDDAVAINNMKQSEYNRHPCYAAFSLESYIGVPIYIDEKVYGTINFSSSKPKGNGFNKNDRVLIKLLGEWAAATIKRVIIEHELNEKNKRLEIISNNSADLICLHDLDGTYKFISPSVEYILGYKESDLLGKNHKDLIHKEDLLALEEGPVKSLAEKEVVTNIRYRILNRNDDYIWVESSVKVVKNNEGERIGLQSNTRDISEQIRLETIFAQAQKMANVGAWEFDLSTGKLHWTDEVYRIHDKDLNSEVFIDEGLSYFPEEARSKLEKAINHTIETGEKYDLSLPFISEKGVHKWVRAIGQANLEGDKAVTLSGTFQDISKQVNYENRIKNQNVELLKLTETKDKLYSIIAHDLKGAFFGINGVLGLLLKDVEQPEINRAGVSKKMKLVHNSAKHTYELLENLLEWIKLQSGDLQLIKEEVDLSKLINKSLSILESSATNKQLTIKADIENISINADKNMINTLLRNLISNAIKYSHKNGIIEVKANNHKDYMSISVKDYGVGMPDSIKSLLFDKEKRPQRSGTLLEKGTGLGLLLCMDIVDAHNGSIKVISEENEGSNFIVTIPYSN